MEWNGVAREARRPTVSSFMFEVSSFGFRTTGNLELVIEKTRYAAPRRLVDAGVTLHRIRILGRASLWHSGAGLLVSSRRSSQRL